EWTAWSIDKAKVDNSESYNALLSRVELGEFETSEAFEAALAAAGITDENLLTVLRATYKAYENGVTDQKEAEACGLISAEIAAGTYATKEALEAALAAAGITDDIAKRTVIAEWTAWYNGEQDQVKTDVFDTIALDIETGVYATVEDALAVAAQKGITDSAMLNQIKSLWNKWNGEYTQTYNSNYAIVEEMAKSSNYTADEIRSWCERLGIDKVDDINALIGFVQKNNSAYIESGKLTADDIEDIEKGVKSGDISAEDAEKWRADWVDGLMNTEDAFLDQNGARYSKKDATEILNNTINNAWCTPELKAKLQKQFDSIYKVTPVSITCDGTLPEKEGRNFYMKYDSTWYSAQNGGMAEGDVVYAAEDVADGSFFVYGEEIYFKQGGTVYIIKELLWDSGRYRELKDILITTGVSTTTTTTSMENGGSVTQTNYSYDHGGKSTQYTITNPDGSTETLWSFRGH
ncbi:MAG: hypothetical protein IKM42_03600, partial [Clostridia bacterium]|nr:hypothetical protein [Clostridia bacterium]